MGPSPKKDAVVIFADNAEEVNQQIKSAFWNFGIHVYVDPGTRGSSWYGYIFSKEKLEKKDIDAYRSLKNLGGASNLKGFYAGWDWNDLDTLSKEFKIICKQFGLEFYEAEQGFLIAKTPEALEALRKEFESED